MKDKNWCEKRLEKYNDKVVYKSDKNHEKIIIKQYQEILKKLEEYYKKQWLSKAAYDIINNDVKYLINNL